LNFKPFLLFFDIFLFLFRSFGDVLQTADAKKGGRFRQPTARCVPRCNLRPVRPFPRLPGGAAARVVFVAAGAAVI